MKVKAVKILTLSALGYITEGKEYSALRVVERSYGKLIDIVDDAGDSITILLSSTRTCTHGVDWEEVE